MIDLNEEIEKIKIEKEFVETLPKNNKRNLKNSSEKIDELYKEFSNKKNDILIEIGNRFKKIKKSLNSIDVIDIENRIKNIDEKIYLLNDISTSYEKMGLDENIHNLKYYYKKDMTIINFHILDCIKNFEKVGIKLTASDFIYNNYVNEYINQFFYNIENLDSLELKENFEKNYWKCPEIITYIELNIRYLYFKNKKKIDKFFEDEKQRLLNEEKNIFEEYNSLKKDLYNKKILDEDNLINNFLLGKLNPKDYNKDKLLNNLLKYIPKEILDNIDDKKLENLNLEMIKFVDTLNEYKVYTKYKFFIDDVDEIFKRKDKNKKTYDKILKDIKCKENKVISLNKKSFFNNSEEKNLARQTAIILELRDLYRDLDKQKVCCKIESYINENSTLLDLLHLASSFYEYMFDCIKEKYKDMPSEEIAVMINELRNSMKNTNYTILNNIVVGENKNIIYIIKDKYQLSNININKEDLDEDNLENLISELKKYEIYYSLMKNKLDLNEISELCEFNKILKDN